MSNGDKAAGDGAPITINGQRFTAGLGHHAPASQDYALNGAYSRFTASVGVDDTERTAGSVRFQVWVDGQRRYESPLKTGNDAASSVSVDVSGGQALRLVVTDGGNGNTSDHGDWGAATLTRSTTAPTTPPPTTAPPTATPTTPPPTTAPPTTAPTTPPPTTAPPTTPPPTTAPTTPPSTAAPGAFPDATSTGAKGTLTSVSGGMTLSTPGQVLENVEITGQVVVKAANVTLRNVKIVTNDFWVILNQGANLTVEDSTLIGGTGTQAGIGDNIGGYFTGRRLDISGAGDGLKMATGSRLFDSYIHDLATFDGAHNDGIEITNAVGVQVVHNTILNKNGQTSAVMVSEFGSKQANVLIADNLLGGGGFTVYGGAPDTATGIVVRNNRFTTRYFPRSGYYGAVAYWSANGNTWTGNTWLDGPEAGKPLNP